MHTHTHCSAHVQTHTDGHTYAHKMENLLFFRIKDRKCVTYDESLELKYSSIAKIRKQLKNIALPIPSDNITYLSTVCI